jgi:hypothetical protein
MEGSMKIPLRIELREVELAQFDLVREERVGDFGDPKGLARSRGAEDRHRERAFLLSLHAVFKDQVADAAEAFDLLAIHREQFAELAPGHPLQGGLGAIQNDLFCDLVEGVLVAIL